MVETLITGLRVLVAGFTVVVFGIGVLLAALLGGALSVLLWLFNLPAVLFGKGRDGQHRHP